MGQGDDAAHPSPSSGRVDASDSERPGGECVPVLRLSPHPTRARLRLHASHPPRKRGGMMWRACRRSRFQFSSKPPSFSRCGCIRVIRPMRARNKSEGARDAGGPTDPRASMPRDTEAERRSRPRSAFVSGRTASPPSLQRPARGVLRLSSAWPPVAEWFLPTALDPDSAWPFGTELRRCRQRAR
jgi:hypothetical protein